MVFRFIFINKLILSVALMLMISNASSAQDYSAEAKFKVPIGKNETQLTVTKAIDGDTLKLSNGKKVRLIGIDTPESTNNPKTRRDSSRTGQDIRNIMVMGKKAKEFCKEVVEGKNVRLEYDVQERDRYGRLLAYVYIMTDVPNLSAVQLEKDNALYYVPGEKFMEIFLNATLVKAGYAQIMTIPPNVKYQDLFLKLQQEAREHKRGFWA